MRAVVQRVSNASVEVSAEIIGKIRCGLLIYVGVGKEDTEHDAEYLVEKIINLRIFEDEQGKMNDSLLDIKGEVLIISQFTLYGDCRKGRRPGFSDAAPPQKGEDLFNYFVKRVKDSGVFVQTGIFARQMFVNSVNDGPVTIFLDSTKII